MATRINVQVTEADIARAKRNDSYTCVVAQAIARTLPDASHIDVDIQTIRFTREGERFVYLTPYVVQGYIVAFDAGEEIEPFSFQLRDPKRIRRLVRTEAGKAVGRAEKRDARRRSSPSKGATKSPERDEVKAAYAGAQLRKSDGAPKGPPRVHKKRRRAYGHRTLRINREDA